MNYSYGELVKEKPLMNNSDLITAVDDKNRTVLIYQKPYTTADLIFKKRLWKANVETFWAIFALMLKTLPEIFNTAILANYGDSSVVAGAGLAVMFINMFVYGVFEGLNGAIDTLASQAYGASDYYTCNLIYNRARFLNSLLFIPVATLLASSKQVLDMMGQPEAVSENTQRFLFYQLPGLFTVMHFDTMRRYLQTQGSFDKPTKVLLFTFTFHCVFLTTIMKSIDTNPLILCASATNVTFFLNYFLLKYYSSEMLERTNYLSVFKGVTTGWKEYLNLAIPSAFILCAEWWMYEALALFSGMIGVVYLATLVIIFNTHNLVYNISYGLSQAASSQIGRTLAELGKRAAKKLLKLILIVEIVLFILMTMIYLTASKSIIKIYTDEDDMIELFVSCKYLISIMFVIDSSQIVLGGIIRGIGEQGESSIVSFISYGLITLPLTVFFCFYFDMRLHGILLAYILGITFNTVFNTFILLKSDWELTVGNDDEEDEKELRGIDHYFAIEDKVTEA